MEDLIAELQEDEKLVDHGAGEGEPSVSGILDGAFDPVPEFAQALVTDNPGLALESMDFPEECADGFRIGEGGADFKEKLLQTVDPFADFLDKLLLDLRRGIVGVGILWGIRVIPQDAVHFGDDLAEVIRIDGPGCVEELKSRGGVAQKADAKGRVGEDAVFDETGQGSHPFGTVRRHVRAGIGKSLGYGKRVLAECEPVFGGGGGVQQDQLPCQ